jgi:hypothetical protein
MPSHSAKLTRAISGMHTRLQSLRGVSTSASQHVTGDIEALACPLGGLTSFSAARV